MRQEMLPLLKEIASVLKGTTGEIVIAGHTDNVPVSGIKFRSNLQLLIERAARVTELLLAQEPIAPERISAVGFGKFRPLKSNGTAEGRKKQAGGDYYKGGGAPRVIVLFPKREEIYSRSLWLPARKASLLFTKPLH